MKTKEGDWDKRTKVHSRAQVRATISFPPDVYETLEVIAKEKKVSLAWVVRDASEKYIADKRERHEVHQHEVVPVLLVSSIPS